MKANALLLLQLVHRRVGDTKNNRDEGEERLSVDALPRPEKHNQHVEERLKCLDSVRGDMYRTMSEKFRFFA